MAEHITVGILAHVDAGKTTLAEALLYQSGTVRKQGFVDSGNTVMDFNSIEQQRGITVFAGEAHITSGEREYILLDTPGHIDFSAETERTLGVLDLAILVISGTQPIQSHTITLFKLLRLYHVPTLFFVTKMDVSVFSQEEILTQLQNKLHPDIISFENQTADIFYESLAVCGEEVLEEYLQTAAVSSQTVAKMIASERCFGCFFGSGLKLTGVKELMNALDTYCIPKNYIESFGAKVFKITHDTDGAKITHLKITGGALKIRDSLFTGETEEKVSQIRIYQGAKYKTTEKALAGEICAVKGISSAYIGEGFGFEKGLPKARLEPIMKYRILLPAGTDAQTVMPQLRQLEEEEPMLHLTWLPHLKELSVLLMGEIQAQILIGMAQERFDLELKLDEGRVLYKETIEAAVEGVGHYEPLRHYAEVHLLLEPLPSGSGIQIATKANEDSLDRNWQRLILTHIKEKQHLGVLTGSPLTDVKITLMSGRAHLKHTEGGDFRQATYRAIRMGLMNAKSVLLEPVLHFTLELPVYALGRAMTDFKMMSAQVNPPEIYSETAVLSGTVPATEINGYAQTVASYTSGAGRLQTEAAGYEKCHNAQKVICELAYLPESDPENSPDSVFCAHGAGFTVKWDKVPEYMHLESCIQAPKAQQAGYSSRRFSIDDKELQAILEKEFGKADIRLYRPKPPKRPQTEISFRFEEKQLHYIIDGYNVIFCWEELNKLAKADLEAARNRLLEILSNFAAFTKADVIVVFDAYKVANGNKKQESFQNIRVVFTKENEPADLYIERLLAQIGKNEKIRLVTSDNLIQLTAVEYGILRISSKDFEDEIIEVNDRIADYVQQLRLKTPARKAGETNG